MTFYKYRERGRAGRPFGSRTNYETRKTKTVAMRDQNRLKILRAVWKLRDRFLSGQVRI